MTDEKNDAPEDEGVTPEGDALPKVAEVAWAPEVEAGEDVQTHTIYDPDVSELGIALKWSTLEDEGATMETLIDVIVRRLEGFQAGDFACTENGEALDHLRAARAALDMRTARRRDQGVEGTLATHVSAG